MSKPRRYRPPVRIAQTGHEQSYEEDFEEQEAGEAEEEERVYIPQRVPRARQEYGPRHARAGHEYSPRNLPPRQDPFRMVMGALIGATVVGLMAIVFLITTRSNAGPGTSAPPANPQANSTSAPANSGNSGSAANPGPTGQSSQSSSGDQPPRMPLEDFKKLYDDPSKRPLIIDVRAKDIYDQGHIKGAISFPEADVDTRVGELPKDKLVIAYCQ